MEQKNLEVPVEMSPEEAAAAGAFAEDALSEADALASVNDPHETPAEALGNQARPQQ